MGTGANLIGGMLKNTAIGRALGGIQAGAQAASTRLNPFASIMQVPGSQMPAMGPFGRVESDDLPGDARAVSRQYPQVQTATPTPKPPQSAAEMRFTTANPNRPIGKPADTNLYGAFMNTVKAKGLTNPYGLAAVAATGQHESGWADKNVFGKWSDPSESGQAGTSGGALSWRAERYQAMKRYVQQRGGDSASAQAEFFMQENPGLIAALNKAQSADEAQRLMNNAWRFAGYDKAGGEAARRIQTARAKAKEFGGSNAAGVPLTTPMSTELAAGNPTTTTSVLARGTEFPAAPPTPTAAPRSSQDARSKLSLETSSEQSETAPAPRTPIAQAVEQWKVNKTTRRMRGMGPGATIGVLTAIGQLEREEQERRFAGQPRIMP